MHEKIKTDFKWEDRKNEDTIIPCNHCEALNDYPTCDDGVTSSACNYCDYNIILNCLKKKDD